MKVGIEVSLDPEVRELLSEEVRTLKEKGQPSRQWWWERAQEKGRGFQAENRVHGKDLGQE